MVPRHERYIFQSKLWRVLVKKERFPQGDSECHIKPTRDSCGYDVENSWTILKEWLMTVIEGFWLSEGKGKI